MTKPSRRPNRERRPKTRDPERIGAERRQRLGVSTNAELAQPRDLKTLIVNGPVVGWFILGTVGKKLVATENRLGAPTLNAASTTPVARQGDRSAVAVIGPQRSGKTANVVGPAGSGKTVALEVAARAWESAGYTVLGAAGNGTAAEVLANSTGITTSTVASLTKRLDLANSPVLNDRTVVLVDEASTRQPGPRQARQTRPRHRGDHANHW